MKTYASLAAFAVLLLAPAAFADTAFTATPATGTAPLTVSFNGPVPAIQNMYTLNFGDGSTAVTVNQWPVTHTYATVGTFSAKLHVSDTALPIATTTVTVTAPGGGNYCLTLQNEFGVGDTDDDTNGEVSKLQAFLAQDSNIYPEGKVTGFFGALTERAVKRYQAAHNIPQTGYVGPRTRAALAACTNTGNPSITLSLSPSSAAQGSSVVISWQSLNVATDTALSLRLLNANGQRRGLISVGRAVSGTFSWTIPYASGDPEDILNNLANCNANGICTGTLPTGSYLIQAALYTPANAFEEELQPIVVAVSNKAALAVTAKSGTGIPVPPPPTYPMPSCTLLVQPASISAGQSATLVWFSSNAAGGTISGIGSVGASGVQTVTPAQSTVYTGTFTGAGGAATCNASIIVTGGTGSIISLTAAPSSGKAPLPVLFTWVSSNANTLQFGDGQSASVPATGATSHTYSSAGTFTAKLLAGASELTTTTVQVTSGGGGNGILSISPSSGAAPLTVTASVNTPNLELGSFYQVQWGDGSANSAPIRRRTDSASHTYASAGTYTATLTLCSSQDGVTCYPGTTGVVETKTVTVTAGGGGNNTMGCSPDPVTVTGPIPSPRSGRAPLAVKFTLSYPVSHAVDGIDFGDGTPILSGSVSNQCVVHTYASAGTYTASFTWHGQPTGMFGDSSVVTVTN